MKKIKPVDNIKQNFRINLLSKFFKNFKMLKAPHLCPANKTLNSERQKNFLLRSRTKMNHFCLNNSRCYN